MWYVASTPESSSKIYADECSSGITVCSFSVELQMKSTLHRSGRCSNDTDSDRASFNSSTNALADDLCQCHTATKTSEIGLCSV